MKIKVQEFPSKRFAHKTGIKWLYKDYKLPLDCDMIGYYATYGSVQVINKIFDNLIELNPEIKEECLKIATSRQIKERIILGVISKFILEDIIHFVSLPDFPHGCMKYNLQTKLRLDRVRNKTGISVQWVPCPNTLSRMEKELNLIFENGSVRR